MTAQAERFQHVEGDGHAGRFSRQRDAHRVADALREQEAQADGAFNRTRAQAARFGDADMQGIVAGFDSAL